MALTSAAQVASGTPAADFYTTVTGIMAAAGWTDLDTLTAAEAGNTGDAAENVVVHVWGNAASIGASTCFIYISVNETGTAPARIRFRCSEGYDSTGAQPGPIHPCPGMSSAGSITPATNDSVAGTEDGNNLVLYQAVGTSQKVGWVDIPVSAGGFAYVAGANGNEVVVCTSPARQNWVHAGRIPAADNLSPATTICFLGGQHQADAERNVSWTYVGNSAMGNYRVSREPNTGAVATAGAFCYISESLVPGLGVNASWGGQPGVAHKWLTNMVGYQVYLHHCSAALLTQAVRSHLAHLSSMALVGRDTVAIIAAATSVGDTVTIDGATYYVLGPTEGVSNTVGTAYQCHLMLAKSSAF